MSRVGKKPISIPEGVAVEIEGQTVTVKGPKGEISKEFRPEVEISSEGNKITVSPRIQEGRQKLRPSQQKMVRSLWGTTRALLNNMIKGVKDDFEKKLEIQGLGYKAEVKGEDIELTVGFTHPVKLTAPENVKVSVEKNIISVSGPDLEKVSQFAAEIKRIRKPEPYKGKGIRYFGEIIRRKVGKKAVATTK